MTENDRLPSNAGSFFQASQMLPEEALSPLTDNLADRVKACADDVIVERASGVQHDFGTDHISHLHLATANGSIVI